jgi:hypothetical protein
MAGIELSRNSAASFDMKVGGMPRALNALVQDMQERAGKIRGRVFVSSKSGAGKTVELPVPARLAHRADTRWQWLSRMMARRWRTQGGNP